MESRHDISLWVASGSNKTTGKRNTNMSFKEIEENLKVLSDFNEAPRLRERIKKLESELKRREQIHKKEINRLKDENDKLKKEDLVKSKRIKQLEGIKIKYGNKEYSYQEYQIHINQEAKKVNKKIIEEKAYTLANKLLPQRIQAEIEGYPHFCSKNTKRLIEQVADSILTQRFGLLLQTIFG
jgi:hypothetical protein